jgi:hypothetical protein
MSMKNFNDTTGNRTHELPACSAVPQPTAPSLALIQREPGYISPEVKQPEREADHLPPLVQHSQ